MRLFLTLLVVYAVVLTTACPSKVTIKKTAQASAAMSGITLDAIEATKYAYENELINRQQKDFIARKIVLIAQGGEKFNEMLKSFDGNEIPEDKLQLLVRVFDREMVDNLVDVLMYLKLIHNAPKITTAINSIRASILLIAAALGKRPLTEAKLKQTVSFNLQTIKAYA